MIPEKIVEQIKQQHKWRRYWIKVQQKVDRAAESFVRLNYTNWTKAESEDERKREAAKALTMIKAARDESGDPEVRHLVITTDLARKPADVERAKCEKEMERLAQQLPAYEFVKSVRGAAALGFATIIGEAGNGLEKFPTPGHLWSRLGYAPFEGYAGSTWKRETWRPRSLTAEEWTEHPFKGERYALIHQVGLWLRNAQVEGKEKSGTKYGKPTGPYGQVYVTRRERTEKTHPDWTPGHSHMDAIRVTTKAFLKDLWKEWNRRANPSFIDKPWKEAAE